MKEYIIYKTNTCIREESSMFSLFDGKPGFVMYITFKDIKFDCHTHVFCLRVAGKFKHGIYIKVFHHYQSLMSCHFCYLYVSDYQYMIPTFKGRKFLE